MRRLQKLVNAVKNSFKKRNVLLTVSGSIIAYIMLVIFTFPTYTFRLLGKSLYYIPNVIKMSTLSVYDTAGTIGLALTVTYAVLTGITITNVFNRLKAQGFANMKELAAFLPGFLISGCASCGFSLLSFIGFAGILVTLPYSGNLVRLGGILIMIGLLQRSGNPNTCSIPASS